MLSYNNLHTFALNCRAQSKMSLLCVKSYSLNQFSAYLGLSKEAAALSHGLHRFVSLCDEKDVIMLAFIKIKMKI